MAHYRTMLASENFCAADLWSEQQQRYAEIVVQVAGIKKGEVVGDKGRKKSMPFLTMKSAKTGQIIEKPLGLNATNCKTLASVAGSPNTDKWKELWITLYVTQTEVGREKVDAIRIRPELAQAPQQAKGPPSSDGFDASNFTKEGGNA